MKDSETPLTNRLLGFDLSNHEASHIRRLSSGQEEIYFFLKFKNQFRKFQASKTFACMDIWIGGISGGSECFTEFKNNELIEK